MADSSSRCESLISSTASGGDNYSGTIPFTGAAVNDEVYQAIGCVLKEQQQFELDGYKVNAIKRRMAARMRAVGLADAEAYLKQLVNDVTEQQQLLQALSIHVSSFFRNPSAFRTLTKKVIPLLLDVARSDGGKVRFWSVGCARGEEVYSLAILCDKLKTAQDQVVVIGTDISADAIRKARRGCYAVQQLRNVSPDQLARHFTCCGDEYQVTKNLRQTVQFFRHDLVTERPFYRADLILCRNLLIYFSRDQQRKTLETLARTLAPGGYLMLGRAETMAPDCHSLFQCIDPAERIYQRTRS